MNAKGVAQVRDRLDDSGWGWCFAYYKENSSKRTSDSTPWARRFKGWSRNQLSIELQNGRKSVLFSINRKSKNFGENPKPNFQPPLGISHLEKREDFLDQNSEQKLKREIL